MFLENQYLTDSESKSENIMCLEDDLGDREDSRQGPIAFNWSLCNSSSGYVNLSIPGLNDSPSLPL